jgi:hypothetical protein
VRFLPGTITLGDADGLYNLVQAGLPDAGHVTEILRTAERALCLAVAAAKVGAIAETALAVQPAHGGRLFLRRDDADVVAPKPVFDQGWQDVLCFGTLINEMDDDLCHGCPPVHEGVPS